MPVRIAKSVKSWKLSRARGFFIFLAELPELNLSPESFQVFTPSSIQSITVLGSGKSARAHSRRRMKT